MKVLKRLGTVLAIAPLLAFAPVTVEAQADVAVAAQQVTAEPRASVVITPAAPAANAPTSTTANLLAFSAAGSAHADATTRTNGPTGTAVALRMKQVTTDEAAPLPRGRSDSKALMIVGLAAVVAGIVVGDDAGTILILGGAGVGLYGLYKYMQ
jgi:hypothetical protein